MKNRNDLDEDDVIKIYKIIGQNVKRIRQEKNISQLKLSQEIGHKSVSGVACSEICHRNYHFNIKHLYKIALALDVDIKDFFDGIDTTPKK